MYIAPNKSRYLERIIRLIAGLMIGISIIGTIYFSIYRLILAGLVSLNLIVFALTGFCTMANVLVKFGVKPMIKDK